MRDPIEIIKKKIQANIPNDKFRFGKFDVHLTLHGLEYKDLKMKDLAPISLHRSIFVNETDVENTQTFSVDKTTTDQFSWTLKEGLKVGEKFKVKIPIVGESETTVDFSFESTQTQTTTVTRRWGYTANIRVPPHTTVETVFSILEGNVDTPFEAIVEARGTVFIEFDVSSTKKKDWRECGGDVAEVIAQQRCVPNMDPKNFEASSEGVFKGLAATQYVVETKNLKSGSSTELKRGSFHEL